MNLRQSSKKQAKIKLALQGCAGSGKTYSALLLAHGLAMTGLKLRLLIVKGVLIYTLTWEPIMC